MTEQEKQAERSWALRMAELEDGCVVRAGNKSLADMVAIARLQEEWVRQQEKTSETRPSITNSK